MSLITVPYKTHTINSHGATLHAIKTNRRGAKQKDNIVLLHGYPDCHEVWSEQINALADEFNVIAFDCRGAGQSWCEDDGKTHQIDNILADIHVVIEALCTNERPVHLVGHDWGSCLGWSYITHSEYRKTVASYTSISGPHISLMLDWTRRKVLSGKLSNIRMAAKQFFHSWYTFAFNIPRFELVFEQFGDKLWKNTMRENGLSADDPYLQKTQDEIEAITVTPMRLYKHNLFSPPPVPDEGSINLPVNLIILQQDNFILPMLFDYLHEYFSDSRLLSRNHLNAKHWALRSHPEEVTSLIRDHIHHVQTKEQVA